MTPKAALPNSNDNTVAELRALPPRNLSAIEAARYAGVSERTLRDRIARRELKAVRIGRRVIVRLADLDAWLERQVR